MVVKGSLLINSIALFLLGLFASGDVKVEQDIPGQMSPGEEVLVTAQISKGELTGFAKLQLEVPSGVTITAVDKNGASFTFANGKAKFIWMALPYSETFSISYYMTLSPLASGSKEITGSFNYIEDNERKSFDLPEYSVEIDGDNATASNTESILSNEPEMANLLPGEGEDVSEFPFPLISSIQGPGGVSGERTISKESDDSYIVSVIVDKQSIRGFGKLQETIPEGFVASNIESDDAIFTTQQDIVKFVWLNLPPKEELNVQYRIVANRLDQEDYKIDGQFGYLLNDETQKTTLASTPFTVEGETAVASNTVPPATEEAAPVEPEPESEPIETAMESTSDNGTAMIEATPIAVPEDDPEPPAAEETMAAAEPTPAEPEAVSNIPAAESGITYKVQISAAHKDVGRDYFIVKHKFHGDFGIERHQGWIKYLTGKYGQYSDAKARRKNLVSAGHNFPGPFVTAYNEGERITVQEALMISNQRWVQ